METSTTSELRDASATRNPARSGGGLWRLPLLLAVVLLAIVAARASQVKDRTGGSQAKLPPAAADPTAEGVSLVLRSEVGKERKFDNVAWRSGMTVDDLMSAAGRGPNGFVYRVSGDGQMSMLTAIDQEFNEWESGRNWTYEVNGTPGDRSFVVFELKPGDRVLWTFGKQQ